MNRANFIAIAIIGIAGCGTSSPEAPEPYAGAREPVNTGQSTGAEDQLEVAEVPEVPKSANIVPPATVVCHREKELGSRRSKRVCRSLSEVERTQADAEEALDELQRAQGPVIEY